MYGTEEEQLCMNANSTGKEYPSVSPALRKLFKDEKDCSAFGGAVPKERLKRMENLCSAAAHHQSGQPQQAQGSSGGFRNVCYFSHELAYLLL